MSASHVPAPYALGAPVSSALGLPTQIPGYTNVNFIRNVIHFPGLHPEADIEAVHFRRRKTKGFSNGHYLQVNPQAFYGNKTFRRTYFSFYFGGFCLFNGLFAIQQYRKGKWWFGETHVPQFYNDAYLERIGRKL